MKAFIENFFSQLRPPIYRRGQEPLWAFFSTYINIQDIEKGLKTLAEVGGGNSGVNLIKRWFPVPGEEIQYC